MGGKLLSLVIPDISDIDERDNVKIETHLSEESNWEAVHEKVRTELVELFEEFQSFQQRCQSPCDQIKSCDR